MTLLIQCDQCQVESPTVSERGWFELRRYGAGNGDAHICSLACLQKLVGRMGESTSGPAIWFGL